MADSFRDFPGDPGSEAMMHVGPVAYTEAIYDLIKKCADVDDCGEYVVMSAGVFANSETSFVFMVIAVTEVPKVSATFFA